MGWDFVNDHVQPDFKGGQFASAECTLVAAGPPRLPQMVGSGTGLVYHIGMLENIGIQQSKQLQRIFEIGSSRSYFIPGRVIGSLSLGRVFYYGPSLLKAIYAYYKNDSNGIEIGTGDAGAKINAGTAAEAADPASPLLDLSSITTASLNQLKMAPGEDNLFINLASDMFNQGTGMAVYFKDSMSNLIGAMYLEDCFVQGHQINVSSGSVLIMEGVSMQFDRAVPIKVTAVGGP